MVALERALRPEHPEPEDEVSNAIDRILMKNGHGAGQGMIPVALPQPGEGGDDVRLSLRPPGGSA